ncbi:MAG: CIA30 family protein [Jannaschia sp.]
MQLSPDWEYVADTVMGGVSQGRIIREELAGRAATRLTGLVSLDNNGGFVQMAFDLLRDGSAFDASSFSGLEMEVLGNGETYDLRLRTDQLTRPWQSFRAEFVATSDWTKVRLPFDTFEPHRTGVMFDPACLRRIGVLAIGRAFEADVAVASVRLVR